MKEQRPISLEEVAAALEHLIGAGQAECWIVMAALEHAITTGKRPVFSQGQMLRAVGHRREVSKATIARAVDRLVDRGLLVRARARREVTEPDLWTLNLPGGGLGGRAPPGTQKKTVAPQSA